MNEALKQFTDNVAEELKAKFASSEIKEFIDKTKASGDDRTFEVVMSTSDEDRQGDELDQSRWELKYYSLNPVVLWAHNYSSFPIGVVTDIQIDGNKAIATGKFAPAGINPDADMACALYQAKVLRAVSPGYIQNDDGSRELLEVSFCPVPAGRYALSLRQVSELGISTRELVTKGFFYETKGAVPYHDYGEADPDEAWDGPAEVKECGEDFEKLKAICAWFDGDSPDAKSSYKLPHHRASDRKAVWKGVAAAGAALQGGRGGVDIPEKDRDAVKAHLAKHYAAFGKTPPWEEKSSKGEQIGDPCEMEDGDPGVLAEQDGKLVCVPADSTEKKTSPESMKKEITKKFKAEHERHQKSIAKAIDEYKSVDEFEEKIGAEQGEHLDNTLKAIDESYELQDQQPKKAIDEFKSEMKEEHLKHVKAIDKAIDEFKSAYSEDGEDDEKQKAIDDFTKSAATELDRHEAAHKAMCAAEFGEGEDDEKDEKFFIDEATSLGIEKSQAQSLWNTMKKSGRAISAKNKGKIADIVKAIEDHHEEHRKFTDEITAALKAIMTSGDGGEEPSDGDEPDRKSHNSRSSTSGASAELEGYLIGQRLVRQVKSASEDALRQFKKKIGEARASDR